MNRLFLGMLLCSSIFLLTSCNVKSEFYDLAICGSYAVPGMYCDDLKGNSVSCDVIEKDLYGRILFKYETNSIITSQNEIAYVICQKYDSDYVYFYEDECYLFAKDFEKDSIELKEKNDWNKQLDESKMSRRENKLTFDLQIANSQNLSLSEIEEICASKFQVDSSDIELQGFVDCDSSGKELLLISNSNSEPKMYFVLINNYNTAVLEATDQMVNQSQLAEFKRENSWVYGF